MKKGLCTVVAVALCLWAVGAARATIISITTGKAVMGDRNSNLVVNGSFENRAAGDPAVPTTLYWSGVSGSHTEGDPNAIVHTIPGWGQTSGPGAYGIWGDASLLLGAPCADGLACVYFGNYITTPSPSPTFHSDGTVTFASPPTFTNSNSNNQTPTTLSQSLGLTPGQTYLLDFWTTGEHFAAPFPDPGVFGLSIGGDSVYLTTPSANSVFNADSIRYYVKFTADSAVESLSFTNWGHIITADPTTNTELILDDLILNKVYEPIPLALFGIGLAGLYAARRPKSRRSGTATRSC